MRPWETYKAVVADIDDTVCPSTRPLSAEMARTIGEVVRGGRRFAFISGSTMAHISAQVTPFLDVPHQLMAASGSHYTSVEYAAGRPVVTEIHRLSFSPAERELILGAIRRLVERRGLRSLTSTEDQIQDRGSQITLSALGRHAPEEAKRAFDPDGSLRLGMIRELVSEIGGGFTVRRGGTSSIDVTPGGMDKAWGIRRFLEHNRLDAADVLFFGDNLGPDGNDAPALRVVDCVAVSGPDHTLALLRDPAAAVAAALPAGSPPPSGSQPGRPGV